MSTEQDPRLIDISKLRRTIAASPEGTAATVTRRFLEQVERELTEGRRAMAQLSIANGMAAVTDSLLSGARI